MSESRLNGRKVVLGVDGGPEAFVAADMVRRLIREGASVQVAVTADTDRWLPPLTFSTLTAAAVLRSVEEGGEAGRQADAVLVMASGSGLLSDLAARRAMDAACAAFTCAGGPKVIRPAGCVPEEPWVGAVLEALSEEAVVLSPGEPLEQSIASVACALGPRDLVGRKVVVTAGPTRESIDPVRFISNPSTGRMGMAVAEAASRRGADVVLLLGPTETSPPPKLKVRRFETADELLELAEESIGGADVFIASAAVGDYAPVAPATEKIKKQEGELVLRLRRTPDVLRRMGERFSEETRRPVLVGFAAETENIIENAKEKLEGKSLDLVVANDVSRPGIGFASAMNQASLVDHEGVTDLPLASKAVLAHRILDRVVLLLALRGKGGPARDRSFVVGDDAVAD